jgi:uncharacterized Zn finger protein
MAKFSRTWWGKVFIAALESFTDSGRLQRGRSYANGGKVKSFEIDGNQITAKVRGSINPYFGVYKEPTYNISLEITPIAKPKMYQLPINSVPAMPFGLAKPIAIKKQEDFPSFWHKDNSFIETMEELYQRVKSKNQNLI